MAIVVQCLCGKTLKAPDSGAGQRAKCPHCGEHLVIPSRPSRAEPASQEERAEVSESRTSTNRTDKLTVGLKCECGKVLHVRADLAGRRIECPQCSSTLIIPTALTTVGDCRRGESIRDQSGDVTPLPTWAESTRGESPLKEDICGALLHAVYLLICPVAVVLPIVGFITAMLGFFSEDTVWIASIGGIAMIILGFLMAFLARPFLLATMPPNKLNNMGAKMATKFVSGVLNEGVHNVFPFFEHALRKDPGLFTAHYNRATLLINLNESARVSEALADLDAAIRLEPGFARACVLRGQIRQSQGDFAQALADFETASRITRAAYDFDEQVNQADSAAEVHKLFSRISSDWLTPASLGGYLQAVQNKLIPLAEIETEIESCRAKLGEQLASSKA